MGCAAFRRHTTSASRRPHTALARGGPIYGGEASALGAPVHEARRIEQRVDRVKRRLDTEQDSHGLLTMIMQASAALATAVAFSKASENLVEELLTTASAICGVMAFVLSYGRH
jgi:hypothetical protein